jgi:hypothetical protein
MRVRGIILSAALGALAAVLPGLARADHYNATDLFNVISTPSTAHSGSWSYGWKAAGTLGDTSSSLHVYDSYVPTGAYKQAEMPSWYFDYANRGPYNGGIAYNPTSTDLSVDGVTLGSHGLFIAPGYGGTGLDGSQPFDKYAMIRWVSPTSGFASLSGFFQRLDHYGGFETDFHVLLNGASLFSFVDSSSGPGPASGVRKDFSFTNLSLSAGDVLDFAEGSEQATQAASEEARFGTTIDFSPASTVPEGNSGLFLLIGVVGIVSGSRIQRSRGVLAQEQQ